MKLAYQISFVLNLGLSVGLICLLSGRGTRKDTPLANPAVVATGLPAPSVDVVASPVKTQPEPKPFKWSQLESETDYRKYVANLRAVGCPEATVEDIVRGDAERVFYAKRVQLHLDGTQPGPWSAEEQMRLVSSLLGQTLPPVSSPQVVAQRVQAHPPIYPLALQNVDLSALGLNQDQQQIVAEIRQDFIDAIGGTNQDSSDPGYLARWQKAQAESDEKIKGMLGVTVFENIQIAAEDN